MGTFVKFGWNGNLYVLPMFVVCELRRFRDKAFDRFDVYGQIFFQSVNGTALLQCFANTHGKHSFFVLFGLYSV